MDNTKLHQDRHALISALNKINDANQLDRNILDLIEFIVLDKQEHYLSLSQDDTMKVSYSKNKENKFNSSKRIKTTLGKYLRSNFFTKDNIISDGNLEKIVNSFWLEIYKEEGLEFKIEELKGKDLVEKYASFDADHSLHSCMCYRDTDLSLYKYNPDKVSLLIFNNECRALLWTTDDGTKFLDRIYPSNHKYNAHIIKWAEKNGYAHRSSYIDTPCFIGTEKDDPDEINMVPVTSKSDLKITLELPNIIGNSYPYLDTFCFVHYIDKHSICISNKELSSATIIGIARDHEYQELKSYYKCIHCNKILFENDTSDYTELDEGFVCDRCYNTKYKQCSNCYHRFIKEDLEETADGPMCEKCIKEYCTECANCGIYHLDEQVEEIDGKPYCYNCRDTVSFYCEKCEERHLNKYLYSEEEIDDEVIFVCKKCGEEECATEACC